MSTQRRSAVIAATLLVLAAPACGGGGDGSAFCDQFRENAESNEFDEMSPDEPEFRAALEDLREKAPDELKDEYDVLVGALDGEGSEEEFQAANDAIIEYTTDNCDVTFPS